VPTDQGLQAASSNLLKSFSWKGPHTRVWRNGNKATIVQGGQLGEGDVTERTTSLGRHGGFKLAALTRRMPLTSRSMPQRRWWLALATIWVLGTLAEQALAAARSAGCRPGTRPITSTAPLTIGRANWGCCLPRGWQGWDACWISPRKFRRWPDLVNGTVMAVAGDSADQAQLGNWRSGSRCLLRCGLLGTASCWARIRLARRQPSTIQPRPGGVEGGFPLDAAAGGHGDAGPVGLLGPLASPRYEGGRWKSSDRRRPWRWRRRLVKQSAPVGAAGARASGLLSRACA